jgi:uncharacterized protein (TIGR04255 family)
MANTPTLKLRNPPIVEAVLDIDCDPPPGFDLASLEEAARARFVESYPKFQAQFIQEHKIETSPGAPSATLSARVSLQALQFRHEDEKQIVQVRAQGFSFNRLAPYTSLDDYLPEIERTWRLYVDLISPVKIRGIRLRYINRILLPMEAKTVNLDEFLKIGPRLPDEGELTLAGFLNQQTAVEKATGLLINLVLTAQAVGNDEKLPLILDITVASAPITAEPTDWSNLRPHIDALRSLKNRIFENSLTEKCIKLLQS